MNKLLYFDCTSGVSSDMLLGSLLDIGVGLHDIQIEVEKLGFPNTRITAKKTTKNEVDGVSVTVKTDELSNWIYANERLHEERPHHHDVHLNDDPRKSHVSIREIDDIVSRSKLDPDIKTMVMAIYNVLARAEAVVHGAKPTNVKFHEVGRPEQLITIAAICVAIRRLGPSRIRTGKIHDGSGHIMSAHGQIPVPVPAVVEILKNWNTPVVIESDVSTEMVTPSGIAILVGLEAEYDPQLYDESGSGSCLPPDKALRRTGCGFGKRDTGRLGAVRALLIEE